MGDAQDLLKYGSEYVIEKNKIRIRIYCPLLLIVSVISIVLNSTIPHLSPSFQLKKFHIPALDKSLNSSENASIAFSIYLWNMDERPVYFDPINVTFYDDPSQNHSIAKFIIPEFSIKGNKDVHFSGMANATGFNLDGAKREIATNGFKVFLFGLESSVRYNFFVFWKTRRYGYRKHLDVKIGDTGSAAKLGNNFVGIRVLIMFNLIVLLFLGSY